MVQAIDGITKDVQGTSESNQRNQPDYLVDEADLTSFSEGRDVVNLANNFQTTIIISKQNRQVEIDHINSSIKNVEEDCKIVEAGDLAGISERIVEIDREIQVLQNQLQSLRNSEANLKGQINILEKQLYILLGSRAYLQKQQELNYFEIFSIDVWLGKDDPEGKIDKVALRARRNELLLNWENLQFQLDQEDYAIRQKEAELARLEAQFSSIQAEIAFLTGNVTDLKASQRAMHEFWMKCFERTNNYFTTLEAYQAKKEKLSKLEVRKKAKEALERQLAKLPFDSVQRKKLEEKIRELEKSISEIPAEIIPTL